ncbi:hypothetical protein C7999DRAFT_15995 [Corynascus novoguineensis]|uniref:Uncharacterized protein n=1 Tax=Corynascus novoguineensis TaxID=1126955 RepID=A0AAN7CPG2_9PEZI|nr:hypothetical protein C7999DRAFT_15995 [Corynascus novoguineensis]
MAGRPRRRRASSTSTTTPFDHPQIRWAKESSVLKPVPRDMPDSEWPCYVLSDATIYRNDGKTLANPLLAHVQEPLIVRGLLEVDEDKLLPNLVRSNVKAAHIEIPHSERYSIGDGPLVLWVSGAAGWFEIRPSSRYQPMYDQVREAITLYYSAFEVYEAYVRVYGNKKKSRRPPPPSLDEIFLKYAVRAGDGILRHEVEALCHKWAEFLIPHFDKEVDLDWDTTRFAKWLRNSHPDVRKRLADIANGLVPLPPPPSDPHEQDQAVENRRSRSARASSGTREDEDDMRGSASNRSHSSQSKFPNKSKPRMSETPVPVPEKYRQFIQPVSSKPSPAPVETPRDTPTSSVDPESPVDRLLAVLDEVASETDIKKAAPSKVNSAVFFKCKIRVYSGAKDILAFYAKELLPRLDDEWRATPWYQWLADSAKQPWKPTEPMDPETIPAQTLRRTKMGANSKATSTTRPATQLPPVINLTAKTRSVWQHESESEDELADLYTAPQRSRTSGKRATLRLATSSKKRPHSDVDDQANGNHRGTKLARVYYHASDEDDLEDEETGDDEVAVDEQTVAGSHLPLPDGAVRVVVHAERLPTTSPSGPDGTWTCDEEGCTYVVRSADEQDAQQLIQEHFRDHEAQAEKIDLAVKESRGHMPIKYAYFPPIMLLVYMHPSPAHT